MTYLATIFESDLEIRFNEVIVFKICRPTSTVNYPTFYSYANYLNFEENSVFTILLPDESDFYIPVHLIFVLQCFSCFVASI